MTREVASQTEEELLATAADLHIQAADRLSASRLIGRPLVERAIRDNILNGAGTADVLRHHYQHTGDALEEIAGYLETTGIRKLRRNLAEEPKRFHD